MVKPTINIINALTKISICLNKYGPKYTVKKWPQNYRDQTFHLRYQLQYWFDSNVSISLYSGQKSAQNSWKKWIGN